MGTQAETMEKESGHAYSDCLEKSYRVNWTIKDILGKREFDSSRRWLPSALSGAEAISCLTPEERTKLTHLEMGAYAHIFGYVEEFIAPLMVNLALDFKIDNRPGFDAMTNFAAEEVKHMNLFREIRSMVQRTVGFPLSLLDGEKEVARFVLSKDVGAVLLLTACIEFFTQLHYVKAFQNDDSLDPLTKHVFKSHWLEESQHARLDELETKRIFSTMSEPERDRAVDDLIGLVVAVDGLIQKQTGFDVQNLESYLERNLTEEERNEIHRSILRAKRYCFIESGVTHPSFLELFNSVTTPQQQEKVRKNLTALLAA
jgi:hypothetical protein